MEQIEQGNKKMFEQVDNSAKLVLIQKVFETQKSGLSFYNKTTNTSSPVYVGFTEVEVENRVKKDYPELYQSGGVIENCDLELPKSESLQVDELYQNNGSVKFVLLDSEDYKEGTASGAYVIKQDLFV